MIKFALDAQRNVAGIQFSNFFLLSIHFLMSSNTVSVPECTFIKGYLKTALLIKQCLESIKSIFSSVLKDLRAHFSCLLDFFFVTA